MAHRRVSARTFIAVVSLGGVGLTLGVQAVAPGLPEIQRSLGLSNSQIGWMTTTFVLPGILLTIPMGLLGDAIGRRFLFCMALTTCGFAAIVQATTNSYAVLLTMRALQGVCFAAAMPLTITLLGDSFTGPDRTRAFAVRNATLIGSELILPLGGALLAGISWRVPVAMQAVAIPLAIVSFLIMNEHKGRFRAGPSYARELFRGLRAQHGMGAVLLIQFSRWAFKFAVIGFLPLLLVNERNSTVTQVGIVLSFSAMIAVATATRVPVLIRWVRPSTAVTVSVVGIAISTGTFAFVSDWRWALAVAAVYGMGDGIVGVLSDTYAMHTAEPQLRAGMVSVNQTARNIGKVASPALMTVVVAVASLQAAFIIVALVGVALAPMLLSLRPMDEQLDSSRSDSQSEVLGVSADDASSHG